MFLRMTITCHNQFIGFLEHLMRLKNHPITSGDSNTHTILAQTFLKNPNGALSKSLVPCETNKISLESGQFRVRVFCFFQFGVHLVGAFDICA
jgi:hypothetical protein